MQKNKQAGRSNVYLLVLFCFLFCLHKKRKLISAIAALIREMLAAKIDTCLTALS